VSNNKYQLRVHNHCLFAAMNASQESQWVQHLEAAIQCDLQLSKRYVKGVIRHTSWAFQFNPDDNHYAQHVTNAIKEDIPENQCFDIVGVDTEWENTCASYYFHLYVSYPRKNTQLS